MAEENFEEVCNNIKACINSSQRQTSLSELSSKFFSKIKIILNKFFVLLQNLLIFHDSYMFH